MKPINIKKVKVKNLLSLIDNPSYEDLLFEIVNFLDNEKRHNDPVFNTYEANLKTRCRISKEFLDDLDQLEKLKYVEKLKYTKYKIIKHLWE